MSLTKLQTVPAWFITDLDGVESFGPLRLGPKVLQSTAKQYARAETYKLALIGQQFSGGAAGIKVDVNERGDSVQKFVSELAPFVEQKIYHPDPAWGVDERELSPLRLGDPRNSLAWASEAATTLTAGAAVAIADNMLDGVSGAKLSLGALSSVHLSLAARWIESGGLVVGVEYRGKSYLDEAGITRDELVAISHGEQGLNGQEGDARAMDTELFVPPCTLAAINHTNEHSIGARHILGVSDLSTTPRALANLARRDIVVLPDFLATTGVTHAAHSEATTIEAATTAAGEKVTEIVAEARSDPDGPFIGTCRIAEKYLSSWRKTLPFGRPMP